MTGQVHWHEGLFLQPHHLQCMQRGVLSQFSLERRLSWAYPYGLVEAKLSRDELENLRVHFDRLCVVMPSGIVVSAPENADLPAKDIKEAFESSTGAFTVSLGVPLWYGCPRRPAILAVSFFLSSHTLETFGPPPAAQLPHFLLPCFLLALATQHYRCP